MVQDNNVDQGNVNSSDGRKDWPFGMSFGFRSQDECDAANRDHAKKLAVVKATMTSMLDDDILKNFLTPLDMKGYLDFMDGEDTMVDNLKQEEHILRFLFSVVHRLDELDIAASVPDGETSVNQHSPDDLKIIRQLLVVKHSTFGDIDIVNNLINGLNSAANAVRGGHDLKLVGKGIRLKLKEVADLLDSEELDKELKK